jgi:hypothetical protein
VRTSVPSQASAVHTEQAARTLKWRREKRTALLRLLAFRSKRLKWSPSLLRLLLEEMYVEEEFKQIVGAPETLPLRQYPHAFAVALTLRHSWRSDDLRRMARRLGVSTVASKRVATQL